MIGRTSVSEVGCKMESEKKTPWYNGSISSGRHQSLFNQWQAGREREFHC